jgi:hypothetical protein
MTKAANLAALAQGPAFRAYNNAGQAISSATATKVSLQVKDFDTASAFDSTTNYRFQPTVAGYYQISAGLRSAGNSRTYSGAFIYKTGSVYARSFVYGANTALWNQVSTVVYLNGSTDYVELYGQTDGTGTAVDFGGTYETYLSGALVRAA